MRILEWKVWNMWKVLENMEGIALEIGFTDPLRI